MILLRFTISLLLIMAVSTTGAFAEEPSTSPIRNALSVRDENDAIGGRDVNYVNGISIALTQEGTGLLGGMWDMAGIEGKRFSTYELTQLMFTPFHTGESDPPPNEHPYAGLLYLGFTTHLVQEESLHSFKLIVGVAGPDAFAEDVQQFVHRVEGYDQPQGWSHQIKNEPILDLVYEYRHKYTLTPPDATIGAELIPVGGAFLGNYLTQAQADVQYRIGYHLPDDFGVTILRGMGHLPFPQDAEAHHTWGVYAFAGGGANLVVTNLVLDGNSFAQSRNVSKLPLLPAAEFGVSFWARRFQTTLSYIIWGKEFSGQHPQEGYISGLVSYFF